MSEEYDVGSNVTPEMHERSKEKCRQFGHSWSNWWWRQYRSIEYRICIRCGLKEERRI